MELVMFCVVGFRVVLWFPPMLLLSGATQMHSPHHPQISGSNDALVICSKIGCALWVGGMAYSLPWHSHAWACMQKRADRTFLRMLCHPVMQHKQQFEQQKWQGLSSGATEKCLPNHWEIASLNQDNITVIHGWELKRAKLQNPGHL